MAKIYEFDPIIYPYRIWIVVDKTPDIIIENFNEYNGDKIYKFSADFCRYDGFVLPVQSKNNPKYGAVIYFSSKKEMSYEIIAHESSHAAKYLFEHIGADIQEHEPFEYVVGWIAKCCAEVKNGKANNLITDYNEKNRSKNSSR